MKTDLTLVLKCWVVDHQVTTVSATCFTLNKPTCRCNFLLGGQQKEKTKPPDSSCSCLNLKSCPWASAALLEHSSLHGSVCTERVLDVWGQAGAVHVFDCVRCSIPFPFEHFVVVGCRQRVLVQLCQVHLGDLKTNFILSEQTLLIQREFFHKNQM